MELTAVIPTSLLFHCFLLTAHICCDWPRGRAEPYDYDPLVRFLCGILCYDRNVPWPARAEDR